MYKSNQGNIDLKIVGYEEPNNGRELHIADLFINGENRSDDYFRNKWNRLNFKLNEFQFESSDLKYVFIPAEGNSFLINTDTLSITYLPYKDVSTVCFMKNEFIEKSLILHYSDEKIVINLNEL
jgi:hypothetical protein